MYGLKKIFIGYLVMEHIKKLDIYIMTRIKDFNGWKLMLESESSDIVDSIALVQAGRLLKPGRSGEAIRKVQNWLGVPETGEYDGITIGAVRKFQEDNPPLDPDGIVGRFTIAQLIKKFMTDEEAEELLQQTEEIEGDNDFVADPVTISDKIKFPIYLSGSYVVDGSVPAKGDAMHSFDRRRSDKFGGRMLRGWEDDAMKSRWGRLVKLDQNLGINQALRQLIDLGFKPDVEDIQIKMKDNKVQWKAKIIQSRDGRAWAGVDTRGSAGGGKENALNQVEELKRKHPEKKNWTVVHEIDRPGLNQFFLKYTL